MPLRIAFVSDHAAVDLRATLVAHARAAGHEAIDLGADHGGAVDYPDCGYRLAALIAAGGADRGVALCGSGIGIAIAVNRHPALRCAQVAEPLSAHLARSHNDANAIAMGARLIGPEMAKACLDAFLSTDFLGGRHASRVAMLATPEPPKEPA